MSVDPTTIVWYEPNVLFNYGIPTYVGALGDPRAGFAFHDYCLTEPETGSTAGCDPFDEMVFDNAVTHAVADREALMETEFGATTDVPYLQDMVDRADRLRVPWLEWAYCGCGDPTTSGPGAKQAIVIDPRRPPAGRNLQLATLRALVEPYPQVISGTPRRWSYDRQSRTFRLSLDTARAGGGGRFPAGSVTEVAAPALVYGHRYGVAVSGGRPTSAAGASLLQIASCPGSDALTVTLTPAGARTGSCPAPPRRRTRRRRRRARARS